MNATLFKAVRPLVTFDPANKEHRKFFNDYVKTGSWKNCPVNFVVDDNSTNLVSYITAKLVSYYSNKEFK